MESLEKCIWKELIESPTSETAIEVRQFERDNPEQAKCSICGGANRDCKSYYALIKEGVLTICMGCEAIKISKGLWLGNKNYPELRGKYQQHVEKCRQEFKLSHGYCLECEEKANKEFFGK